LQTSNCKWAAAYSILVRLYLCTFQLLSGTRRERGHYGGIASLFFQKGSNGGGANFS